MQLVHINQAVIRDNHKTGARNPPIIIRGKSRSKPTTYCHNADLVLNGVVVGTFKYSPDKPLDCGARLWFESDNLEIVPRRTEE